MYDSDRSFILSIIVLLCCLIVFLVATFLGGCAVTSYVTPYVAPYGTVIPEGVNVSHTTFMADENVGDLRFIKNADELQFELGHLDVKSPEVQAFRYGIKLGKALKEDDVDVH